MKTKISVEEAESLIAEAMPQFPAESCPIAEAQGRILREDIRADRDLPPFDRVMMDGVAVTFDAIESGQREFLIEATSHAGTPQQSLVDKNEGCIEVMTGTMLPLGCSCVIPYEDIKIADNRAHLNETCKPERMQFVHLRGSDRKMGRSLLKAGTRLLSPQVAVAAAVGNPEVKVAARPRVAFVSTGNELVELGEPCDTHQIRPINNYGVPAALRRSQIPLVKAYHAPDDPGQIRRVFEEALAESDILLISGGMSKGKQDYVPGVLEALGVKAIFHKVRQRPGKPMWFGVAPDKKPVFGLPGNPVAALVGVHRYVLPAIEGAMGFSGDKPDFAELMEDIVFEFDLTYFPPVALKSRNDGALLAEPLPYNNSGDFSSLANSEGFIELEAQHVRFPAGSPVRVYRWR